MKICRSFYIPVRLCLSLIFIGGVLPGMFTKDGRAQQVRASLVNDVHVKAVHVDMKGLIGQRLNASYHNRILAQDVDKLVAPFRNRIETFCWQSEFWGKWITSAVLAYRYQPTPGLRMKLEYAVRELISTQSSDGYIGNYAAGHHLEQWDIWGRKYCLLGLIDYYDLTDDKNSLVAAIKLADHLIAEINAGDGIIVNKGNYRGMAASSVLEPICLLYTRTNEDRFLQFAKRIVSQWESPDGPNLITKADWPVSRRFPKPEKWYSPEQGQKAYEMMSCYEGLLELYRITGNETYKKAVEKTWERIKKEEINIAGSGAAVEMWFGGHALQAYPVYHSQETCVTVTWIKLSQQLFRLTGEARYADAVEESYYNALLAAMSADGAHWAKYTPLTGHRLKGSEQCKMGLNCCEASGPRGLFTLPFYAAPSVPEGVTVNYFSEGAYTINTPAGQALELTQLTDYPVSGKVNIALKMVKPEELSIGIRIPAWSKNSSVWVNGIKLTEGAGDNYMHIKRNWKSTDAITIELDMRARFKKTGTLPQYFAIKRGPVVLARDSRFGGPPMLSYLTPASGNDISIRRLAATDGVWMKYAVSLKPESYAEFESDPIDVIFCDYASAGNGDTMSGFRVWLPELIDPRTMK